MKYKYKNLRHDKYTLDIPPGAEKTFDHEIRHENLVLVGVVEEKEEHKKKIYKKELEDDE